MIAIVCVDENMGIMFNNRRISKDSMVIEHIIHLTEGKQLWMNKYSEQLFADKNTANVNVADKFTQAAEKGNFCFFENTDIAPYENQLEKIILFKWNRKYPSDFKFTISLSDNNWKLVESEDFAGSSHEKITKEVYIREE